MTAPAEQLTDFPVGQTAVAIGFLKGWGGYPTLTAIFVDPITGKTGRIETKAFPAPVDWDAVAAWVDQRNGKANLYFLVNQTREPKDNKALKADIVALKALHIDVDVRVDETQAEGIARIVKTFNEYKIKPTVITSSGGGAQAFWIQKEPVTITDSRTSRRSIFKSPAI